MRTSHHAHMHHSMNYGHMHHSINKGRINMNNQEYENKYENVAKTLRIVGWFPLLGGIACVIIAMADFFSHVGGWEAPKLFFLNFVGFPLIVIGAVLLANGYRRKIIEFNASQTAPAAKNFGNYIIDETSDSVAGMAGKVANQVNKNAKGGVEGVDFNTCAKCGTVNPADAKFCSNCGAPVVKKCPYCGAENDDGAKYCKTCGRPL